MSAETVPSNDATLGGLQFSPSSLLSSSSKWLAIDAFSRMFGFEEKTNVI